MLILGFRVLKAIEGGPMGFNITWNMEFKGLLRNSSRKEHISLQLNNEQKLKLSLFKDHYFTPSQFAMKTLCLA